MVCVQCAVQNQILTENNYTCFIIQIWMLTGDKLETATCIAKSSRLVSKMHGIYTFRSVTSRTEAHLELNSFRRKNDCALIITGASLEVSSERQ